MRIVRKYLVPVISAAVVAVALIASTHWPEFSLWFAFGALAAVIIPMVLFRSGVPFSVVALFILSPAVLTASGMVFLLTQSFGTFLVSALSLLIGASILYAHIQIGIYSHEPARYEPFQLEYFSRSLNALSIYFYASSLLMIHIALGLFAPYTLLAFASIVFLLAWHSLKTSATHRGTGIYYASLITILSCEVMLIILYLPTNPLVSAFPVAVFFLTIVESVRRVLLHSFTKRFILHYVILGIISLVIVLGSARWI